MAQPMSSLPYEAAQQSINQSTNQSINPSFNARDHVLRGTLVGSCIGFTYSLIHTTFTRSPMLRTMTTSSVNGALTGFTYTSLTVALDKNTSINRSMYTNHLLSGVLTGTSIYGMMCAPSINNAKDAIRVSMRGALGGAACGSLVWYFSRDKSTSQSTNQTLLDSSPPIQSTNQPTDQSPAESWSPIRRSSPAELQSQASDYEARERRAAQLKQAEYAQLNQSR